MSNSNHQVEPTEELSSGNRTYVKMGARPVNRLLPWTIALLVGTLVGPVVWAFWILDAIGGAK